MMRRFVLDTSVIIEYIVLRSPYRPKVVRLFEDVVRGRLELYVSAVTLSEVLYVASRVYQIAGVDEPNREAMNFVGWVRSRVKVVGLDEDVAVRAGELKKRLRIALPDCYVIATAVAINATPLFKRLEEEMRPVLDDLRRLGVGFLDEVDL